MIIDFHTHIFPEKIAEKAVGKLAGIIKEEPNTNGTAMGLLDSMKAANIDISVVLPTVTSPSQLNSVTKFALSINEQFEEGKRHRLLSFAGIHPDSPNYKSVLTELKSLGFRGIKIHPDYQNSLFDDMRYMRIIEKASELGLITITHTGYDCYSPNCIHCTTSSILHVLKEVRPRNLVLAHMGNNHFYDQVEDELIGQDVYLDTAYSIRDMPQKQLVRMIENHGAEKILFATDCPWNNQKHDVQLLKALPISEEEKEMILYKNAMRLLRL